MNNVLARVGKSKLIIWLQRHPKTVAAIVVSGLAIGERVVLKKNTIFEAIIDKAKQIIQNANYESLIY